MAVKSTTEIAVRYRFVFKKNNAGVKELKFLPHKVKRVPCDKLDQPEKVQYLNDVKYLRSLDPKEWKTQDHYRVLGIPTLRNKATEETIRTAYRKKVLQHHPDKSKANSDDVYYTCITKAYEILGDPKKRRSYDSVDPEFDNTLPSLTEIKKDFYKTFTYYFDLNSRWSEKVNVPKFGGPDSSTKEVEDFYNFWYDFKSWREFSYEDEEDKEACTGRGEKRYAEKLNKAERARKKREETARIRGLVDLAFKNDPRVAKIKQEEKERKLRDKKAKLAAVQKQKEDEEKALREVEQAKEKALEEEKAKLEAKRKEREAQKKVLRKERKKLRDVCKNNAYFAKNPEQNLKHMMEVEKLCQVLNADNLKMLNLEMETKGEMALFDAFAKLTEES